MSCGHDHDTHEEYNYEQVKIDTLAPGFDLPAYDPIKDDTTNISTHDLHGKWKVLFFYPADFTFVCPTELKDMAGAKAKFDELGVTVLAASTDTVFSHRAWVKHEGLMKGFPYLMLADHNTEIAAAYNILDEESGIAGRGTFIIDPEGICRGIEVTSGPLGRNSDELIRKIEALQFMAAHPGTACPAKWAVGSKTLTPSIKISGEIEEQLK
ncbi:peroxiredoxin [Candidatus Gracilibacteria bacterium]|nr:peroxiredoxin [Candidatus Gracilibacteria bacterium]